MSRGGGKTGTDYYMGRNSNFTPLMVLSKQVYTERSEVVGADGIEPSTSSLSVKRSTGELRAHFTS